MPSEHSFVKLSHSNAWAEYQGSLRAAATNRDSRFGIWEEPNFPSTNVLVASLRSARSLKAFELSDAAKNLVSYRVSVEADQRMLRFRITSGSEGFLFFVDRPETGFEVLELICSGFQYHWRSDLAKVAESRVPHLGRIFITGAGSDCAVEHLAIPLFRNHRLIEISGWFCFEESEISGMPPMVTWDEITIARRLRRSQPIRLPRRLRWDEPDRWRVQNWIPDWQSFSRLPFSLT